MDSTPSHDSGSSKPRKPYAAPALVRYGDVRLLTRSATGTQWEQTNPSGTSCPPGQGTNPTKFNCTSDARTKENVIRVGTHPWGFGLYLFDYRPEFRELCGTGRQFGVIAQEVEQVCPDAVSTSPLGFRSVDYDLLGIGRTAG